MKTLHGEHIYPCETQMNTIHGQQHYTGEACEKEFNQQITLSNNIIHGENNTPGEHVKKDLNCETTQNKHLKTIHGEKQTMEMKMNQCNRDNSQRIVIPLNTKPQTKTI